MAATFEKLLCSILFNVVMVARFGPAVQGGAKSRQYGGRDYREPANRRSSHWLKRLPAEAGIPFGGLSAEWGSRFRGNDVVSHSCGHQLSLSVMLYAWKCFGHTFLLADDERSVRFARRSIELD